MRSPLSHRGAVLGAMGGVGAASKLGKSPLSSGPPAPEKYTRLLGVRYLHPLMNFVRTTTGTYRGPDGLLKTAAINEPRFEYDLNGNYMGLLKEGARTNICLQSETFDNASWTKTRCSVTANSVVAPDGNTTADTLTEDSTASNTHVITQAITIATATSYAASVFLKAGTRTIAQLRLGDTTGANGVRVNIDLTNGTLSNESTVGSGWTDITATSKSWGNGWYQVILSGTSAGSTAGSFQVFMGTGAGNFTYTGDGVSNLYLWGAQLESTTPVFAGGSSYIATTTASVSRGVDQYNMTDITPLHLNPTEGTFYLEGDYGDYDSSIGTAASRVFIGLTDGSSAERLLIYNISSTIGYVITTGSSQQSTSSVPGTVPLGAFKAALGYAQDNFLFVKNGVAATPDFSGLVLSPSRLEIGSSVNSSTLPLYGHIKEVRYYRHRLSDAMLQAITS